MSLTSGAYLGPYEILAPIGAGGMGEVYRARDTRLDRTVAVKVLPAHVAERPEARQRFEREARAVSSLNHPHICALYDIGHQDGIDFLVMEYLEGETLAARLAREPMPLDQTLRYAIEIGEALGQAHRQGVFHRDLKPGNIMLTKAGSKLLDFGLAKVGVGGRGSGVGESTVDAALTKEGTILGTLPYMAPEQLEGKETDATGDIFSFGAVLYEMVTGRKAFSGSSQASVIAAILSGQPAPMTTLQPSTPKPLESVVQRCLAKDREERWQSAHDLAGQLKWIAQSGSASASTATPPPSASRRERLAWAAVTTVLLVSAVTLAAIHFREVPAKVRSVRFQVPLPEKVTFDWRDLPAVSPDGGHLAFTATAGDGVRRLWVRSLDSLAIHALPGTDGALFPFWSPDSRFLGFFTQGKLKKIDASGGPVEVLADAGSGGGTWSRDGVILFPSGGLLYRVASSGGNAKRVATLDSSPLGTSHEWPHFLPDGRHFFYWAQGASPGGSVGIGSLDANQVKHLALPAGNVAYVPGQSHLLFVRNGVLVAQPFDTGELELSGEPVPLAEQVALMYANYAPGGAFSASENGVLAYRTRGFAQTQLVWLDRAGKRLGSVGPAADYSNPALSPDDKKLAVSIRNPQTKTRDIWVFDLIRGASLRLTFDPGEDTNAVWSPDGARIAFTSDRKGQRDLYQKIASGTGADEVLLESRPAKNMEAWSPDGRFLLYTSGAAVWALPLAGDRKPIPVIQDLSGQSEAQISPNGRWIAYRSMESGRNEVFVQNFTTSGGKWQVSTAGGTEPKWRRDGKELFYIADTKLMAVDVKTETATFEAGIPKPLFEVRLPPMIPRSRFEVTGDGQRFLVNTPAEDTGTSSITVVLNWPAGMRR